jgi:hypothetical protein
MGSCFDVRTPVPDLNYVPEEQDTKPQQQKLERFSMLRRSFSFSTIEESLAQNGGEENDRVWP